MVFGERHGEVVQLVAPLPEERGLVQRFVHLQGGRVQTHTANVSGQSTRAQRPLAATPPRV
jgi:hypothetical protein